MFYRQPVFLFFTLDFNRRYLVDQTASVSEILTPPCWCCCWSLSLSCSLIKIKKSGEMFKLTCSSSDGSDYFWLNSDKCGEIKHLTRQWNNFLNPHQTVAVVFLSDWFSIITYIRSSWKMFWSFFKGATFGKWIYFWSAADKSWSSIC